MQTILEKLRHKPSIAVRAAITGLRRAVKRNDFMIDMSIWGDFVYDPYKGQDVCCGCLATCTLQELYGVELVAENISDVAARASAYFDELPEETENQDRELTERFLEVSDLEYAINDLRLNDPKRLYIACGIDPDSMPQELREVEDMCADGQLTQGAIFSSRYSAKSATSMRRLDRGIETLEKFAAKLEALGY